jgi:hypothetical protein
LFPSSEIFVIPNMHITFVPETRVYWLKTKVLLNFGRFGSDLNQPTLGGDGVCSISFQAICNFSCPYLTNFAPHKPKMIKVAPGMGFEPMRTRRSTGSQGPRVIHSAIPAPQCNWVSCLFLFSVPAKPARSVKVINRQAIGRSYGKQPDRFGEC